ncbi:hypothetical protein PMAYCL1PPCAC_19953, partial [Pristionchus mayeri]
FQVRLKNKKNAAEFKRMTIGVWRTTVAAVLTSTGSWLFEAFFLIYYFYAQATGRPLLTDLQYSSIFISLNTLNNILPAWTMLIAFPNVFVNLQY